MITISPTTLSSPVVPGNVDRDLVRFYALVDRLRAADGGLKTIGITSSASGEGVTTVASGLAAATAQMSPNPVLLIDFSASGVSLAKRLGVSGDPSLARALENASSPCEFVRRTALPNLSLLSAASAQNAWELMLDRHRVKELLVSLGQDYSQIILDLLPVTESSPSVGLAGMLDGVLLVVEAEQTRREAVQRSKQWLLQAQANLVGAVMNKRPEHIPQWLYERL